MKTLYYKTSNFIQHTGNVVDLGEYRRKLALAQQDSLARQPEEVTWPEEETSESAFRLVVLPAPQKEDRQVRRAWTLDNCASLAVIVMTLLFALRVML